MTRATTSVTRGRVSAMLGVAAGCWAVAIRRMRGMDTGAATALRSFGSFVGLWVPIIADPLLVPGLTPAMRGSRGRQHPSRICV
jgi:hypothetical protein